MTPDDAPKPLRAHPNVRGYVLLCLTGLLGMVLALIENDRDLIWILLLAAVGAVGVVFHWRIGPPLVLLGLSMLEWFHFIVYRPWAFRGPTWEDSPFMDAVLAASVLAYAAGHYRMLSVVHTVFPIDNRRPPPRPSPTRGGREGREGARQRRSADLPGPWETPLLAIAAGVWAVAVSIFWMALSAVPPPRWLDMSEGVWRGLLLIFITALTTAVLSGAAAYLHWAAVSPEEHLIYLQDQAWRETRPDQNRINRWLTWARLRAQRRKEQS